MTPKVSGEKPKFIQTHNYGGISTRSFKNFRPADSFYEKLYERDDVRSPIYGFTDNDMPGLQTNSSESKFEELIMDK